MKRKEMNATNLHISRSSSEENQIILHNLWWKHLDKHINNYYEEERIAWTIRSRQAKRKISWQEIEPTGNKRKALIYKKNNDEGC